MHTYKQAIGIADPSDLYRLGTDPYEQEPDYRNSSLMAFTSTQTNLNLQNLANWTYNPYLFGLTELS